MNPLIEDRLKLLVKDNFLDNPNDIRNIALSIDTWRHHSYFNGTVGWKGYRSRPLQCYKNSTLNKISEDILSEIKKVFFLSENYLITTFFHMANLETKQECLHLIPDKYHKDPAAEVAGVLYLTPNPPPFKCGTSILDPWQDKIIDVENVYNRIVAYKTNIVHAITDLFGNDFQDGRMTLNFFVHTSDESVLRQIIH